MMRLASATGVPGSELENEMSRRQTIAQLAIILLLLLNSSARSQYCATCLFSRSPTFCEQLDSAEAFVVAKCVEPGVSNSDKQYLGRFEVVQVVKGEFLTMRPQEIKATLYEKPAEGQLFVISGSDPPDLTWNVVSPASLPLITYLDKLSRTRADEIEKLRFFARYLEDKDESIARDALDEMTKASSPQLARMAAHMDRVQLLSWIKNPKLTGSRRSLYFRMLGACGSVEDLPMLEAAMHAAKADSDLSDGLAEVIATYLLLRGSEGLSVVEDQFIKDMRVPYETLYSAIEALEFHVNRHDVIPKEQILEVMHRVLVKRDDVADLVVADMAHWEDWSQIDTVYTLFAEANKKTSWVRVPIINYLRQCPLEKADRYVEELRKIDPDAVRRAFEFFLIDTE